MRESRDNPDIDPIRLAIAGASGRMGRLVAEVAAEAPDIAIAAAWVGASSTVLGKSLDVAPTVHYGPLGSHGSAANERPAVVVDFSSAQVFDDVLAWCLHERIALVSGTTGLSTRQNDALAAAGNTIPVLWSANFSPGVAVLRRALADAAQALPAWEVEIIEAHHRGKRDAPSGTALALGRAVAEARGQSLDEHAVFDRHSADRPRQPGDIGFSVVRAGDIVGEHTVILAAAGERLELGHRATDRRIFARGALHAARWLFHRGPGLHRFEDSLR